MTENEAYALMGRLTALVAPSDWSDQTIEAWVEQLVDLGDLDAATDAVMTIQKTWRSTKAPSYGVFRDAYVQAMDRLRREKAEREGRGSRYDAISLTEHLDRALARADLTEIRTWAHHAKKFGAPQKNAIGDTFAWNGELVRWFQTDGRQHFLEEAL